MCRLANRTTDSARVLTLWIPAVQFILLVTTAYAQGQEESDRRFSLEGSYLYGEVDGYVQTPSGGESGTTSSRRPSLDEIGISNTSVYDSQFIAALHDNELYLGGQWIRMSGSATLDETLITQGKTFDAGMQVSSEVDLDWYRFGYRRRLSLCQDREWTIWPSAGVAVLDFSYHLRGTDVAADRSYIKLNAQFGLETEWRPRGGPFSLDLVLLVSPPISSSLPQMNVEELVAKYRVFEHQRSELEIIGGVAFEQIYFEDNQNTSNRIKADFGPMIVFGLNWRF